MSKTILYIAMSLDGYIATNSDDVSWLSGDGSEKENMGSYDEFIESVSDIIMGYQTYNIIDTKLSPNEWVYKGKNCYVLTNKTLQSNEKATFTNKDIKELINSIKENSTKNIWICGGGNIASQFIEKDLIDEYYITIIPTILGSGVKLFNHITNEKKLKLQKINRYNGIVDLVYTKR